MLASTQMLDVLFSRDVGMSVLKVMWMCQPTEMWVCQFTLITVSQSSGV